MGKFSQPDVKHTFMLNKKATWIAIDNQSPSVTMYSVIITRALCDSLPVSPSLRVCVRLTASVHTHRRHVSPHNAHVHVGFVTA